ncbi:periplasmic binding protein-like II [Piromyces finnis]|uniref:Periplasmic binding protein-like II n=1 Tax=Piromyces finnis TaxID=1754191 RepID=A0A1Y1UZQ1_9FUNG|nr:periplasmic binding protein-like II [Piromyces finnis]|eukprot:ORX44206.1 periplasmic binding protein-like II [Piromyces finnis]
MILILLKFIFIFCIIKISRCLTLNAIANYMDGENQAFTLLINDFNNYAIKNNLDIKINFNLFTMENSTSITDFESTLESLLKKKTNKYDIYIYDGLYTERYGPYLYDLNSTLPKNHINMYDSDFIMENCIYKDKIVSLPVTLGYKVLYYNENLLNKYNKTVPETWDEFLATSKYIMDEEYKLNNLNFIPYNGFFDDSEEGMCSLYQYIYSFRKSPNSPFPEITSPEVVEALKMLKKIKNTISTDEKFMSNYDQTAATLSDGSGLFLNFWIWSVLSSTMPYKMANFPGREKGISGSTMCSFNIGIGNDIKIENKMAAIEAIKYITSLEVQKKYLKNFLINTAIYSLYNDTEVCSEVDCELFKNLQPINRPGSKTDNYLSYSQKFRDYIYNYLYGNKTVEEVLKKIDDITRIHKISIHPKESLTGFIFSISIIVISVAMFLSMIFLFLENYSPFFEFLTFDFWIINIIGAILILCSFFMSLSDITVIKCQLHTILISVGVLLNFIPVLYRLIVNFPEENLISTWTYKHGYLFSLIFIIFEMLIDGLLFINSYSVESNNINSINEGENYNICKINSLLGKLFVSLIVAYKIAIAISLLILVFIEWNISTTFNDLKFIVSAIYIDTLSIILIFIFNYVKMNSYISSFIINECIIIMMAVSNYVFLYGFRVIIGYFKKRNTKAEFVNKINQGFIESETNFTKSVSCNYHFATDSSISYKYSEYIIYNTNTNVNHNNNESNTFSNNNNKLLSP